jgi:two-component system phosphate regulon sensor histidine kinase PhoR
MFRKIRWRIAIPFVALFIILLTVLGLYLVNSIRQSKLQEFESQLTAKDRLLADYIRSSTLQNDLASIDLDAQAMHWANLLEARITIIAPDGTVLGESDAIRETMDNHLNRPEIQQAIADGFGKTTRFSQTEGRNEMYIAIPVENNGEIVAIARVALPLAQIQAETAEVIRIISLSILIASILAIVLATLVADYIARPIYQLTDQIRDFSFSKPSDQLIPPSEDEIGQFARVFNDLVTQLRFQYDALETERSKLVAVLEQLSDGVLIIDNQGMVRLINPAAQRIFGISEAEAMDQSIVKVLRQHQLIELWKQAVETGESQVIPAELPNKRLYIQGEAIPLGETLPGRTLMVFQDITHVRHLETVRRDFISNISHELRTPLASLKALTETLQESALDDPPAARRFLTRIETEVDALSLMVQELVELSRIESGKVPLQLKSITPEELLSAAVERLRLQAERSGLMLHIDCPQDLPPVLADPPRMEQVVVNLLHNAIKFTPKGGKISLTAQLEDDSIVFSVQDTGVGISSVDLPRIFERFYKADRARSGGGTGLGLAISRHLIEAHSGRIWAESTEGIGSTFYFSLPLAR